jgi:hypothetical protein
MLITLVHRAFLDLVALPSCNQVVPDRVANVLACLPEILDDFGWPDIIQAGWLLCLIGLAGLPRRVCPKTGWN